MSQPDKIKKGQMVKDSAVQDTAFWDEQGVFIRPGESEASYTSRIAEMNLHNQESCPALFKLYGFSPQWIDVFYSNKGLHVWEAGASWIDEQKNPPEITIQLKEAFKTQSYMYGIYSKGEVLQHEYVHAARFLFLAYMEESKYDEHFSYATSLGRGFWGTFRAFLGPLFQKSYEVMLLFFLLVVLLSSIVYGLSGFSTLFSTLLIFYAIVLVLRLVNRWKNWFLCQRHLSFLKEKTLHFMIRLTDEEIDRFASFSNSECYEWIQCQNDFRFGFLKNRYL